LEKHLAALFWSTKKSQKKSFQKFVDLSFNSGIFLFRLSFIGTNPGILFRCFEGCFCPFSILASKKCSIVSLQNLPATFSAQPIKIQKRAIVARRDL
jgi:hypothetical protein